ncbi:alanine racemase [Ameyamaea chiangmaiensis]
MVPTQEAAGGWLSIDLDAIAANYRTLREAVAPGVRTAAAVKADCYGLGAARVVPVLEAAGCRNFFVATLEEGIALRAIAGGEAAIFVLGGPPPGCDAALHAARLVPVLNSLEQIAAWRALARTYDTALHAVLQLDSGMSRLGLGARDVAILAEDGDSLSGIRPVLVMSHLACADEPAHPANRAQRDTFERLRAQLPPTLASLAASSGTFLGPDWHYDLIRPGAALYGLNPTPGQPNPMRPVVRLQLRSLQTREIEAGTAVGYGARFIANRPSRIATLAAGYADGLFRAAGGRGYAVLPGQEDIRLPIVGRVSMDCLALDITALGETPVPPGTAFDLIGPSLPIDDLAAACDTIGYEVLTALGHRYHRHYRSGDGL